MFSFFKDYLNSSKDIGFKTRPELETEIDGMYSLKGKLVYFNGKNNIEINPIVNGYVFMTDLASIPKKLEKIFPNKPKYNYPAILHDYLYTVDKRSDVTKRVYADWHFLQALKSEGVSWYRRWIMFLSVRMFGKDYYRSEA